MDASPDRRSIHARRADRTAPRSGECSVALLEHQSHGLRPPRFGLLRLGDGEDDEEERHADPVVEPALDVEAAEPETAAASR